LITKSSDDPLQDLVRVSALAGHDDVGKRGQEAHQPPARDRLIVGDQDPQRRRRPAHVGAPVAGPSGRVTVATVPSPTASMSSMARPS
jgi:hypothetical protein